MGKDCLGRDLDLTYLINKPDGYLQGKLSDTDDADYYKFNIGMYRTLRGASEKYDLDFTITLDNIPEGCDYDLILYDGDGNQVGIGQDNGNGGKSVTVPNWNMESREYTVKVLAKNSSPVNADEYYHLSFQTKQAEDNVLKQQLEEAQNSAKGKSELNTILKEEIYPQMEKEGIDLSQYSFSVQISAGGQVTVEGIDDEVVKTKVENIFSRFVDRLIEIYFVTDTSIQNLYERDKTHLKSAVDIEKFLYKATKGSVSLDDLTVENGKIKGLPANLDKLINITSRNLNE